MSRCNYKQQALSREQSKMRAIAVYRIMSEGRKLTVPDIARILHCRYGITVDRKTIYDDLRAVNRIMPLEFIQGRNGGYKKLEDNWRGDDVK